MLKTIPPMPPGYVHVGIAKIRSSDLCWDSDLKTWVHPNREDYNILGSEVEFYDAVCRKENGLSATVLPATKL